MTFDDIMNAVGRLSVDQKKVLLDKLSRDEELWQERMIGLQKKIGKHAKTMGLNKLTMEEVNQSIHKYRAEKRAKNHT